MRMISKLATVLAFGLASGCGVVDAATGGVTEADIPAIESNIESGIQDQSGLNAAVDCPSSIDWSTGSDFRCVVTADDGSTIKVTVYMENDEGDVTWEVG